jgi:hypothetical protein
MGGYHSVRIRYLEDADQIRQKAGLPGDMQRYLWLVNQDESVLRGAG